MNRQEEREEVSTEQEELMTEEDAARYLSVSPERLTELATQGELRLVMVRGPEGIKSMYFRSEVLQLKEKLRGQGSKSEVEEWPDMIGE